MFITNTLSETRILDLWSLVRWWALLAFSNGSPCRFNNINFVTIPHSETKNHSLSCGISHYRLCISKGLVILISPVASLEVESVYVHKSPSLCFHQSPGDGFYIAVGGGIGQHGWCHIQNILQDKQYDVKFEDHSEKMGMLSIQGPKR